MNANLGCLLAVLGGVLMGSFSLPMKKTTRWAWETTWLVWAVTALVVVPWAIAAATVPDLLGVYGRSGSGSLARVFLFGVGWGLGAVMFGQSISLLGMSLAFAISIGLTLALGALVPMASDPGVFLTGAGMTVTAGIGLMVAGVIVSAAAGRRKEAQMRLPAGQAAGRAGSTVAGGGGAFVKGLALAVLSGVFNPMLNFAFNFSGGIKGAALAAGASEDGASDAIWAIALLGGFAANLAYCSILLTRHGTWSGYVRGGTLFHWPLAVLMGVTWEVSLMLYGRAANLMGALGGSAGWAITMGCCIAASNAWGIATGEWRQGRGRPLRTMYAGLAVILAAIGVIGWGNALSR